MQGGVTTSHSSSLPQVVCDWAPSKLSELIKTLAASCSPPEVSLSSYNSYRAYFEPLLLAELAAELLSATDKYHRSNSVRQPKLRARREDPGTTAALVIVQKVTRQHTAGFGWVVDVDSHDRKGPVGSVDNDVVACWPAILPSHNQSSKYPSSSNNVPQLQHHQKQRVIPDNAVLAIVIRTTKRTGCRLLLSKFPDGNESGVRTDLEEGEENEDEPPASRVWNVLRLGSLTTMRREFDALRQIKTSVLMPTLLRPRVQHSDKFPRSGQSHVSASDSLDPNGQSSQAADGIAADMFRNEQYFTHIISKKAGLNSSQTRAVLHASTCRNGFSIVQGPPGTGKTRTLISLLNVIHMTEYQRYYESILASYEQFIKKKSQDTSSVRERKKSDAYTSRGEKRGNSSLLETMMFQMNKTVSTSTEESSVQIQVPAQRPRLLVCAPSNSAVDEILTRLTKCKFFDGQGREYCPELARIGADDRVSEAAKPFTAEGQAEVFLDRVCAEDMNADARKKAQMVFMSSWQSRCNALLNQLALIPKRDSISHPKVIDLHEKLERMERDLRRLTIAASDGPKELSREEKLRQIARTYVEDAQLVFATLSGSASSILTKKGFNDISDHGGALFDTVVIDESAQATETSCLIPLTLGASRCLLVGDPQQLPATVLSSGAAGLAYGQSLLERICRGGQGVQLLDTQYRMHPAISSFPRRHFYNGRLVDDESVQGENRAKQYHRDAIRPKLGPYVFLDISEGEETRSRDDRSIFNRAEAELASLIYTKLKKEYASDTIFSPAAKVHGSVMGFGVVTPYKRQMQELRQSFDRAGIPTGDVEVDTVDSFQGREKDVVVFSCVRTAAINRGIGFVRDVRRMNVGLTRARSSLIILGSAQALSEGSADWAELIEDASSRGCLISVSNVQRCLYPALPDSTTGVDSKNAGSLHTSANPQAAVSTNSKTAISAIRISDTMARQEFTNTPRVQGLSTSHNSPASRPTDPRLMTSHATINPHATLNAQVAVDPHVALKSQAAINPHAVANPHAVVNPLVAVNPHVPVNSPTATNVHIVLDANTAMNAHVGAIPDATAGQDLINPASRTRLLSASRNPSNLHPADPRLRAAKKAAAAKSQEDIRLAHQATDDGIANASHQLARQRTEVMHFMNGEGRNLGQNNMASVKNGINAEAGGAVQVPVNGERTNQEDSKYAALQSTLEQMSELLADGGFQNTTAVEETLREHLRRGGELDVETVMAAAIASNTANDREAKGPGNAAVQPPISSATSHRIANVISSENDTGPDARERSQPQSFPISEPMHPRPAAAFPSSKKPRQNEPKVSSERSVKSRSSTNSDRTEKANSQNNDHSSKPKGKESAAPSGWDMLFANKNSINKTDLDGEAGAVTNEEMKTDIGTMDSKAEMSEVSGGVNRLGTKDVTVGAAGLPEVNHAKGSKGEEQSESGGPKIMKNQKENGGEVDRKRLRTNRPGIGNENGPEFDRKRPRQNDYRSGFNSRTHGRGERGRVRPKRGRGRSAAPDPAPHEQFSGNEMWGAPIPIDPGFLQYQAMQPGFDAGMGPPAHAMNALSYMRHPALQQQAMQQALQQHALQQQAFQQMQQYQQQEAHRQQQTFMQVPGMAHGVGPPQYVDFDGGYNNDTGMARRNSGRGGSWTYGNGGGRGHRGGRGRGRSKNGGKGKRD